MWLSLSLIQRKSWSRYEKRFLLLQNSKEWFLIECFKPKPNQLDCSVILKHYYATQAVRGPITKLNQSKCSIAGPIFSKYWIGHCPEWSRTCVFAFFSRVINPSLLGTVLGEYRPSVIIALVPYCQDSRPIFSRYGARAWLIRCIYYLF